MNNKKFTIRLPIIIYEELRIKALENKLSANALSSEIITKAITEKTTTEINKELLDKINSMEQQLEKLIKKNYWLSDVIVQIFLNSCFGENVKEKDDEVWNEFLNQRNKKVNE
ncbi:MAG: hypothetical protein Q4G04_01435 [bacterium]|nr:hypothetical protein [bacterium]